MTPVVEHFEAESDPARRREIAGELQRIAIDQAVFPIAGQFASPAVWRAEPRGMIDLGFPMLWNIKRSAR